jgi:predicted RNA-binding protein with TRAM domain
VFVNILEDLNALAFRVNEPAISIETNPIVSSYIIGPAGETRAALEKRFGKKLCIKGNPELKMTDFVVRVFSGDLEKLYEAPFEVGQLCDCFLCEKHNANKNDAICRVNGYVILVQNGAEFVGQKHVLRITEVHQTFACGEIVE